MNFAWSRPQPQSALMLLSLLLAGCAPFQHTPGATAAAPTSTPLAIGLVGAASGPGDFEASFTGNATQLAITTINAAGGISWQGHHYHLTLASAGAADVVQDVHDLVFATPSPVAILGPDESVAALAAAPIIERAHIPALSIATATTLTAPTKNSNDPLIFRARASDAASARALTTYAVQHLGGHGITVVASDNDYGQAGMDVITHTLAGLGTNAAAQVLLEPGTLDFAAQAAQVLVSHSDTVICWSTEIEAARLLHDLRVAGWAGHFTIGTADADFIALAGGDGDGVVGAMTWTAALTSPASQQFVQAYIQRFGNQPDEHAAAAYDAIQLLSNAIRTVGPDHTAITRYLATLTGYVGVQGTFDASNATKGLGASGELTTAMEIVQVQQGQQVLLATQG